MHGDQRLNVLKGCLEPCPPIWLHPYSAAVFTQSAIISAIFLHSAVVVASMDSLSLPSRLIFALATADKEALITWGFVFRVVNFLREEMKRDAGSAARSDDHHRCEEAPTKPDGSTRRAHGTRIPVRNLRAQRLADTPPDASSLLPCRKMI